MFCCVLCVLLSNTSFVYCVMKRAIYNLGITRFSDVSKQVSVCLSVERFECAVVIDGACGIC